MDLEINLMGVQNISKLEEWILLLANTEGLVQFYEVGQDFKVPGVGL